MLRAGIATLALVGIDPSQPVRWRSLGHPPVPAVAVRTYPRGVLRPSVNGHRFLPSGGHRISPTAAVVSPHWWPSDLPSGRSTVAVASVLGISSSKLAGWMLLVSAIERFS